jgi:hypothetical protein
LAPGEACFHIDVIEDSQIKGGYYIPTARLIIRASGAYEFTDVIGDPSLWRPLQTRLKDCSFETIEEGKKALQEIISTMDLSSLSR